MYLRRSASLNWNIVHAQSVCITCFYFSVPIFAQLNLVRHVNCFTLATSTIFYSLKVGERLIAHLKLVVHESVLDV